MGFERGGGVTGRIICINTAFAEFKGIVHFVELYHGERSVSAQRFIRKR